jgi:hypothetical protein
MKKLLLLALLCPVAWCATTTITQVVIGPNGHPGNGTVSFRASAACTSGADYVGAYATSTTFLAGAFSYTLVPNDACVQPGMTVSGGTSYAVTWHVCDQSPGATLANPCPFGRGNTWTEKWVVPSGATTMGLVVINSGAPPSYAISGLPNGIYCVTVSGGLPVVTLMTSCGGGIAGSLAALSNSTLAALNNGQLAAMAN